jgi:CheY-like chemotaxis protein
VRRKIVIVDAEPVVRKTVAAILETEGYEVTQAEDPQEVVEIIESDPPGAHHRECLAARYFGL